MMEFKVRLLVDSQDPEYAYAALRDALQYVGNAHGIEIRLGDSWLKNNEPLPADCAQKIALAWQRSNKRGFSDRVIFQTRDPAVMAELNQTDMFVGGDACLLSADGKHHMVQPTDTDFIQWGEFGMCEVCHCIRKMDQEYLIEGHVGFVPIMGEGQ